MSLKGLGDVPSSDDRCGVLEQSSVSFRGFSKLCIPLLRFFFLLIMQIKDAYMLKFFEDDMSGLPKWCNDGDDVKLPYCQILGKYRMELPEYNTMVPYPHMNERCPSLPPKYTRTLRC